MTWLVTGGAGYIGAHVVAAVREAGESVVVVDDLSTGDPDRIPGVPLVVGGVLDGELVSRTVGEHGVTGAVHLVVASADRIRETLGWSARPGVRDVVESAWAGWTARPGIAGP